MAQAMLGSTAERSAGEGGHLLPIMLLVSRLSPEFESAKTDKETYFHLTMKFNITFGSLNVAFDSSARKSSLALFVFPACVLFGVSIVQSL